MDIYDFTGLTQSIHNSLSASFSPTATTIIEFVIVALAFMILFTILGLVLVYAERKIAAFFQLRLGPMRVGWWGMAQTAADAIKLIFKEPLTTKNADKFLFNLAPFLIILSSFMALGALPFAKGLHALDFDIGILYLIAVSSIGVIGILIAGWSSDNKYSLIGAMRSGAQIISYELSI